MNGSVVDGQDPLARVAVAAVVSSQGRTPLSRTLWTSKPSNDPDLP